MTFLYNLAGISEVFFVWIIPDQRENDSFHILKKKFEKIENSKRY